MPVHDWSIVTAGTWHAFHLLWIAELQRVLNAGLLPDGLYALGEQRMGDHEADVLALERHDEADLETTDAGVSRDFEDSGSGVALLEAPPVASVVQDFDDAAFHAERQRTLVIRHASGDRIVAMLEIVSPGNKNRPGALRTFVEKVTSAIAHGLHMVIIDLHPPGVFDPRGIHDLIALELGGHGFEPPAGKPFTLVSYHASTCVRAYIEPLARGLVLPELPMFYDRKHYVRLPLEATYARAWEGMPRRWKQVIEAPSA